MQKNETDPSSLNLAGIDQDKHQLLADIAGLYYLSNLTQAKISAQTGMSRPTISRLLREARETGIVQISIHRPAHRESSLSKQLKALFPQCDIHVIAAGLGGYSHLMNELGRATAQILRDKIQDTMVLGISWSMGIHQIARALHDADCQQVTVLQLTGNSRHINVLLDEPELLQRLAEKNGGRYLYLSAPLMVSSREVRDALISDTVIAEHLQQARHADIALVDIGTVTPELCHLLQTDYITDKELNAVAMAGGVGEMLSQFYDSAGNPLRSPLHERIIGLSLPDLSAIDYVIGVAAGVEKVPAVMGALRGNLVQCLIIDDYSAGYLLKRLQTGR